MKKAIVLALAMVGTGLTAPFVYPSAWTADPNTANKRGGELRMGTFTDYKVLNPFLVADDADVTSIMAQGAALFVLDPVTDEYVPKMAEAMPVVSNGEKRFVVKLRKGMKFSDGHEITANDFVTTMQIAVDPKISSKLSDYYSVRGRPISVRKLDTYTLQFDFPAVSALAYAKMSVAPWPEHIFGKAYRSGGANAVKALWPLGTPADQLVSPGAWKVQEIRPGQRTVLARNPYFGEWNKDSKGNALPYLDRLSYTLYGDANEMLKGYLGGKIDLFSPRNTDHLAQVKKAIESKAINATLLPGVSPNAENDWIAFNWNRGDDPWKQRLFRDSRFRKAMSYIANRDAMVKQARGGLGVPVYTAVPPVFKNYQFADTPKFAYNLSAAAKLLADIGFSNKNKDGYLVDDSGKVLEYDLLTQDGNIAREQEARIFAADAKKVGVKVNIKPMEFGALVKILMEQGDKRKFDAVLLSIVGSEREWPFVQGYMECGGSLHVYNQPKNSACLTPQESSIQRLYSQGETTLDSAARRKIGAQLVKAEADLQPLVYLTAGVYNVSYLNRVKGEYPRNIMNSFEGQRSTVLTWLQ